MTTFLIQIIPHGVTIVCAQIICSQCVPGHAGVQAIAGFNEPSITFVPW